MNKLYLFAVSLFLLMSVSCTKDDTSYSKNENSSHEYVTFSADILSSRATAENFEVTDLIGIYAIEFKDDGRKLAANGNIVDNRKYTYTDNGTFSSLQPIRSDPSKTYNYYAYYPYDDNYADATNIEFKVLTDQSTHQKFTKSDFLYAKLSESSGTAAVMQFGHKMSRLKFNLTLEQSVDEIGDIKMTLLNLCGSANIDLNDCAITLKSDSKQSIIPKMEGMLPGTQITAEAVVVPQTIESGQALFSVTIGNSTYVYKPENEVLCTSGFTREFNVVLSGGSQLDVITLPEMATYLKEGNATLHLINTADEAKFSVNVTVVSELNATKINVIDPLVSGTYLIDYVQYSDNEVYPIETIISFTAGLESTTEVWNDMLSCFGDGTPSKPYLFSRKEQLRNLATAVNDANNFSGKSFVVTKDIDLKKELWIPIGNSENPFKGSFDGGNFEISGLSILTEGTSHYQGLFGYVDGVSALSISTLKNIKLVSSAPSGSYDISIPSSRASFYAGSIAACVKDNALIENCTSSLKILANSAVGGIVGGTGYDLTQVSGTFGDGQSYANVTVTNCHFSGEMLVQGAWITNPGQGGAGMAGGIVGRNHGKVTRCSNSGDFKGVSNYEWGYDMMGGVVGGNGGLVVECFNTGSFDGLSNGITGKDRGIACGGVVGQALASGVTGIILKSYVSDCYNTGDIKYNAATCGGVIAKTGAALAGVVIDRCYSVGSTQALNGGVLGTYTVATGLFDMQFCVTNSDKTIGNNITDWTLFDKKARNPKLGTTGHRLRKDTDANMKKKDTYLQPSLLAGVNWDWDFDTVWQIDEGSSYPYLRNNLPK